LRTGDFAANCGVSRFEGCYPNAFCPATRSTERVSENARGWANGQRAGLKDSNLRYPMRSKLKKANAVGGFTLIELLTVIAIIGILASILIPTVGRVRDNARASNCSGQMRQVSLALILYANDNRGMLPATSPDRPEDGGAKLLWTKAVGPYLPGRTSSVTGPPNRVFVCPSADYSGKRGDALGSTYSASSALMGQGTGGGLSVAIPRRYESIPDKTRVAWVLEGTASNATSNTVNSTTNWARVQEAQSAASALAAPHFDFRHGDRSRMNMAYADGSVRQFSFADRKKVTKEGWEAR
jgi:prepilin-type N-terminal cleavage/methylation domain-containing protein/prepilin-type processing-associated H-X9-DG protein